MDLADLGHSFVEIIVISDSVTPHKVLNRRLYQRVGRRGFSCIKQDKWVRLSHL
jgi:hypothetical protein